MLSSTCRVERKKESFFKVVSVSVSVSMSVSVSVSAGLTLNARRQRVFV
jgi:hypothetical protein